MHIIIIGNGISGITAARFIRKLSGHKITVISSESKYFYSRTALMYVYMGHMRMEDIKPYEDWFWEKNNIDLKFAHVETIDPESKTIGLGNETLKYDKLVIATGSKSNKFGWPGQDLNAVEGLYSLQDMELMESHSADLKRAVIVGGGLIGIEMAEMFNSRNIPVTMIVREEHYWDNVLPQEEAKMIGNHIKNHHIDLRLGVNLGEIVDDGAGKACAVIIKETGERIDCGYVGLTAGVSPNVELAKQSGIEINRGIKVNEYLETSITDIYAIGDCAELNSPASGRRAVEAIWYTGRMMGETVAYNICEQPRPYDPGLWFNSAKFMDIEYQVYGTVLNKLPDQHNTLFWQHSDGMKSIRINFDKNSNAVVGFNLFGIRYRHEVCEKWILEQTPIETVLKNLSLANFDVEFQKQHEADIIAQYNQAYGKNLSLKSARGLDSVINFVSSVFNKSA